MRTKSYPAVLALTATALSLTIATAPAQYVDSVESLKNHAVAASPRAKEAFPWLTRSAAPRVEVCCPVNELTAVKNNRALAVSPRVLEQFPELARSAPARQEFTIAPLVEKNSALRASPRYREEHPAPSQVTSKDGSSKLIEPGK